MLLEPGHVLMEPSHGLQSMPVRFVYVPIGWCYFPIEFLIMQNHVYLSIKVYDGCIIFWNMVDGYRWSLKPDWVRVR